MMRVSLIAVALAFVCAACGNDTTSVPVQPSDVKTLGGKSGGPAKTDGDAGGGETTSTSNTPAGNGPGQAAPMTAEQARRKALVRRLAADLKKARDSDSRAEAIANLLEFGEDARVALPDVVTALEDEEAMTRGFAVAAVASIDPRGCRKHLEAALGDDEAEVRSKAAEGWGAAEIPDLLPLLKRLDEEFEPSVQLAIMRVIEKNGKAVLAPKVGALLDQVDGTAAQAGVRFLVAHKATAQAAQVANLLELQDARLRVLAAEALDGFGVKSKATVGGLVRALEDEEERVRQAAHKTLKRLTGQDFGFDPAGAEDARRKKHTSWKNWWKSAQSGFAG